MKSLPLIAIIASFHDVWLLLFAVSIKEEERSAVSATQIMCDMIIGQSLRQESYYIWKRAVCRPYKARRLEICIS